MNLVDSLREIIMSDGLIILSIFCFYLANQFSKHIYLCNKNTRSGNAFEMKSVISLGHSLKALNIGLGVLFILHFMNLSGADIGQAFISLINSSGENGNIGLVKVIALTMTIISGFILGIAYKQIEKLDKEIEILTEEAEKKVDLTLIKMEKQTDEAVELVNKELKTIKGEAEKTVADTLKEVKIIKEETEKTLKIVFDSKKNIQLITKQSSASLEFDRLYQNIRSTNAAAQRIPNFESFKILLGYDFNTTSPVEIIDAIDCLSKEPINKEWIEDNTKFSDYIENLYQHFSEIENKSDDVREAMIKIGQFVPDLILPLNISLLERVKST